VTARGVIADHHLAMLAASGVTPEHAAARGYETIRDPRRLAELGIAKAGQRTQGLLVPQLRVDGSTRGYQYRPDSPRVRSGKTVKYETPWQQRNGIDVPPGVGPKLGDPTVPLFVTEGVKKADCAVLQGLYCRRAARRVVLARPQRLGRPCSGARLARYRPRPPPRDPRVRRRRSPQAAGTQSTIRTGPTTTMPRRPPRVCPLCRGLITGGRCSCRPARSGSHSPPGTHAWRKLRKVKLDVNPMCERCHRRPATEVDHVVPLAEDPTRRNDWDNLQSLCHDCHRQKTKEDAQRGKCRAR
jgi:5-methylcytosine-specific restriction endonuclease McrA